MNKRGQAILELALFGAIIIMLLGAVLNYGLRYNHQQKTMMSAFRNALREANTPGADGIANFVVFQDRHIPDPAHPFGVGSVLPFNASGSVIRTPYLMETADTLLELPRLGIELKGSDFTCPNTRINRALGTAGLRNSPCYYLTADFWTATVNEGQYKKYVEIFGDLNVRDASTDGEPSFPQVCLEYDTDGVTCLTWDTNVQSTVRIMDSCEGDIMSYDGCKRQCRMMTDVAFCVRECELGKEPGSTKNCDSICNNNVTTRWYCGNINNIFNFAIASNKPRSMGLQSDYSQDTAMTATLRKQEAAGAINTTDTINWNTTTNREFVFLDDSKNVQQVPITSTLGENVTLNNCD